jgi:4-amino-4-deoxy-L-arabinose transferase-like glycosyltransferase
MTRKALRADAPFLALLGALFVLHATANVYWLSADTRPPTYDTAGHAIVSLRLAGHLTAGEWRSAEWLLLAQDYPPLVYLMAAPLAIAGEPTIDWLTLVNLPFLGLLMLSTYGMARALAGPGCGLLAGGLVSFYPYVYGLSRQLLLDLPLAATVALALWLLLLVERFESVPLSLVFGAAVGVGLLVKTTFVEFLAPSVLVVVLRALRPFSWRRVAHIGLSAVIPLAMAGWWYAHNLRSQVQFVRFQTIAGAVEGDPAVGTARSWLSYLSFAGGTQVMLPLLAAFVAGATATLLARRYRADPRVWVLLTALLVPYVLLSLQPNKDPRYSAPLLPTVAVVTALGLSTVRSRAARVACVSVLGAWALVQFAGLTVGLRGSVLPGSVPRRLFTRVGDVMILTLYSERVHIITPPRKQDWQAGAILADISAHGAARRRTAPNQPRETVRVVVIPNVDFFGPNVFVYETLARGLRGMEIESVTGVAPVADARERIRAADYVVAKSKDQGPAWTVHDTPRLTAELRKDRGELGRVFDRLRVYRLPDRSKAFLFSRVADATPRSAAVRAQ